MGTQDLKELIQEVSNSNISVFEYEENGVKIHLEKNVNMVNIPVTEAISVVNNEMKTEEKETEQSPEGNVITSPLVGNVYLAPGEGMENFVTVGSTVKKGQVVAIVEAMKLMNEIECEYDGIVSQILVENAQTVEYGQPMFVIDVTDGK